MRITLEDNNIQNNGDSQETITEEERLTREQSTGVKDDIKAQKAKFTNLSTKDKLIYIWDYYKWFFVFGIIIIVALRVFVSDYIENKKPVYLNAIIINSNFGYDGTNTVEEDYVKQFNIDTVANKLYLDYSVNLSREAFDTIMLANQQKIVSMYAAAELDVMVGPVDIMEGPANCDCYADLMEILPEDLIEELKDREYEFYYYDAKKVAQQRADDLGAPEDEVYREPYIAGIYLDNCSYLNNNGQYGAYSSIEEEKDRPIFTIAANAPHMEHSIEFLRFLIENR